MDPSLPASEPAAAQPPAACANCGAALGGPWCSRCGQHHRRSRLDVRDLATDAVDQIVGLDTKIGRTLVDLTLRPGQAALDYVQGRRARYVNPLKYMIFAVAAYFLLLAALGIEVTDFTPESMLAPTGDPMVRELQLGIQRSVSDGLRTIAFAAPPFFAWITGLLLGRRRFNFAETCSLWLFATAHGTLVLTSTWLLLTRLAGGPPVYWLAVPTFLYYTWAARSFFHRGWIASFLAVLVSYVALQVFFIVVLIGSVLAATVIGLS